MPPKRHLQLAGPPDEGRAWRRFFRLIESGVDVPDALVVVGTEHGSGYRRIVHARICSLILAMGRDLEVS